MSERRIESWLSKGEMRSSPFKRSAIIFLTKFGKGFALYFFFLKMKAFFPLVKGSAFWAVVGTQIDLKTHLLRSDPMRKEGASLDHGKYRHLNLAH